MLSYSFPTTKLNISREKLEKIKNGDVDSTTETNKNVRKNTSMFPSPKGRSVRGKSGHGHL